LFWLTALPDPTNVIHRNWGQPQPCYPPRPRPTGENPRCSPTPPRACSRSSPYCSGPGRVRHRTDRPGRGCQRYADAAGAARTAPIPAGGTRTGRACRRPHEWDNDAQGIELSLKFSRRFFMPERRRRGRHRSCLHRSRRDAVAGLGRMAVSARASGADRAVRRPPNKKPGRTTNRATHHRRR